MDTLETTTRVTRRGTGASITTNSVENTTSKTTVVARARSGNARTSALSSSSRITAKLKTVVKAIIPNDDPSTADALPFDKVTVVAEGVSIRSNTESSG